MKQLNLYYLGGGGGGSVPDGRTVTPINDAVIWQKCAGISNPTYTSIGEILADSGMLQTLMASDNAVDYLVRCKAFIATRSLVPVMTSDNTPSGVAFASGEPVNYEAYKAFDNNNSTVWSCYDGAGAQYAVNQWVGYDFETPTIVNKIFILPGNAGDTSSSGCRVKNYRIEASDDKVAWDILTSQTYTASNSAGETVTFTNNRAYRYYRCYVVDNITTQFVIVIKTLTFYSPVGICDTADAMTYVGQNNYCADTLLADATWRNAIQNSAYFKSVYNDHNPIMTSNTTPSGVASSQSGFLENPWKAMDGDDVTTPRTTSSPFVNVTRGLIYEFATPICIKLIESLLYTEAGGGYGAATNKIYYEISDDGINWTDLYVDTEFANRTTKRMIDCSSNTISCKYVAMTLIGNSYSWNFRVNTSNYYGRKNV